MLTAMECPQKEELLLEEVTLAKIVSSIFVSKMCVFVHVQ